MTQAEQEYIRRQAHILMQATQEREAAQRAARCGTVADLDGFAAAALAELQRGAPR
jgi:hypothetical protein